tara:strand:- start:11945 stop:12391 length:447 start_codon:yes stop_codon:yes gene_type:complete
MNTRDARDTDGRFLFLEKKAQTQTQNIDLGTMARGTRTASLIAFLSLVFFASVVHATEREYFWNEVTEQSTWTAPHVPVAYVDAESGKNYYLDEKTGETTWEFPGDWKEVQSEEHGRPYYHNSETGDSTWEKPEVLGWKRVKVNDEEL